MDWEIYNLRGPRDQVKATIQASVKLPDGPRSFILGQIDALPKDCFAVSVNGYGQTHQIGQDAVCNVNLTVTGLK